ncbi:hypothetical protein ACFMPD_14080 [Sedimentitalea sp. HM32M-2]|uniref:hypothetical protein n=1 Tax=Sedimentitalea sp. HM32M-2 TaxID=3351566 RepID=UPI0036259D81
MTQTTTDPAPATQPAAQSTALARPVHTTVSETDQFLRRFVVVTATIVASVIALGIIFVTAMMPLFVEYAAPKELVNWGGIIIGFYFGTFASLLKDWLSTEKKGP